MAPRAQKSKPPALDTPPEALIETTERDVRTALAIPLNRLAVGTPLSQRGKLALYEALVRRGLEKTPKALRVPLTSQLATLLRNSQSLPVKTLPKALKGLASAAECKKLIGTVTASGQAVLLFSAGQEQLSLPTTTTLDAQQRSALETAVNTLQKALKSTKPKKGAVSARLLQSEIASLLLAALGTPAPDVASVTAAARALAKSPNDLIYVPTLVRGFEPHPPGAVHAALLEANTQGRIELRPESGVGLLTAADAALCPRAPDGAPLSYLRIVS